MPVAKLQGDKSYSIISDHIGTPLVAIDNEGVKVWERELDIYGKVRKETKENANFVSFRYQGQYYDNEVDLCYNRFRYYDPNSGNYISQDPIGLEGGNPNFYAYVFDTNTEDETHEDFHYNVKEFRSKNYQKIKRVLPPLKYGECYGYTPIPALGGKKSYKTLQIVDAKTYVDMIGQATGKIIDLS